MLAVRQKALVCAPRFPAAACIQQQIRCVTLSPKAKIDGMFEGIKQGNRMHLSKAITLVESTRKDHSAQADYLLDQVAKHVATRGDGFSLRIAISGPPGVGKSTFIEAFGMFLVEQKNMSVAVTAVDPSSTESGGSILGDKTRMPNLSSHPRAYIRPSPTRGSLGGVSRDTSEIVLLCQGAGFNVNIIETVGVGQSEVVATDMADIFVVLVPPASGDDLQGIKRGIIEMADLVVVTKADGELLSEAERVAADYKWAMKLQRPRYRSWVPKVMKSSVRKIETIEAIWNQIVNYREAMTKSGELEHMRKRQQMKILWAAVESELCSSVRSVPEVTQALVEIEAGLTRGTLTPRRAAHTVVSLYSGRPMFSQLME